MSNNINSDCLALSASQKELWYWQKKEPLSAAYNEGLVFSFDDKLDVSRLRQAFCLLAMNNPVLRTVYTFDGDAPVARITGNDPDFLVHSVAPCTDEELRAAINEEYNAPFDLSSSVMRIRIYLRTNEAPRMLAVVHHIACDGWSLKILWNELLFYYVFADKKQLDAKPSYQEFVKEEHNYLQSEQSKPSLDFWKEQLEPVTKSDGLLFRPSHATGEPVAKHFEFLFTREQVAQLREIAHAAGASFFEALLSIYHLSIFFFSREQHVLIGTPFYNRPSAFRQVAGYFVNAIGLCNEMQPDLNFKQQLIRMHEYMKLARLHSHYPFAAIKETTPLSLRGYFQYFFSVRNRLFDIADPEGGLKELVPFSYQVQDILFKHEPQFDLHLEIYEGKQNARGVFHYDAAAVDGDAVEELAGRFQWLCELVIAEPEVSMRELVQLPKQEIENIIALGRGKQTRYDVSSGYTSLFRKQVAQTPQLIAVKDSDKSWTYKQLQQYAANASCCLLRSLPQKSSSPVVAVCLPRSCEQVAAAIAIWQIGGIYMPIDNTLPAERINYMLNDAGATLMICDNGIDAPIEQLTLNYLFECDAAAAGLFDKPLADANYDGSYLLYTSGSTGKPKGVLISAAGMLNHLHTKRQDLQLNEQSIVAQTASVSFDVSVWQTFAVLLTGGCLRIYSRNEVLEIKNHLQQLQDDDITITQMVPSYLREFLYQAERTHITLPCLKYLVSAGEELDSSLATRWFNCFKNAAIANCYGPTEAADNISIHIFNECANAAKVPSGKALNNVQLYVVDSFGNLCQRGITGEVWVSGAGVAAGYIGSAKAKSKDVFMNDPFTKGNWLYKTGDLGKWGINDGLLYFCGRKDRQVKLRGQRVELAEIENAILQCKAVNQAAVVYNPEDGGSIAAYIVWKASPSKEILESFLKKCLPLYMLPAHIVSLESMPLTASGKLDRKQLPVVAGTSQRIVAARNTEEESLLKIWKKVLGKDAIGIHHNFFEHGGHSLKAVQLASSIEQEFKLQLQISSLLQNPTVSTLAAVLPSMQKDHVQIKKAPVMKLYPASGQQQLVWTISNNSREASAAYNMTGVVRFNSTPDVSLLLIALNWVMEEHESLRTNFVEQDGRLWLNVQPAMTADIEVKEVNEHDFTAALNAHLAKERELVFNVANDIPIRLALFVSSTGEACLAGTIHHLAADGISLQLILSQVKTAYTSLSNNDPLKNSAKPSFEYKDYAWWQQEWLQSPHSNAARTYFQNLLRDVEPLNLPVDFARPVVKSYTGKSIEFTIAAPPAKVKLSVIAAIQLVLEAFTGQSNLATGVVFTGRNHVSWNQQVGMFMNTLPLVIDVEGNDTIEEIISRVDEQLSHLQDHQAFPYYELLSAQPEHAALLSKVLINYMRFDKEEFFSWDGFKNSQAAAAPSSKAELEFECYEISGAFSCRLIYDASLFSDDTAGQLLHCFETILMQCFTRPELLVRDIQLMSNNAKQEMLSMCKGETHEYPVYSSYATLFGETAKQHAAAMAVSDTKGSLTYAELDSLSGSIAARLQHLQPQSIVAACINRSMYLPAVIVGIWKAGCIYLPLDPSHPAERNNYILNDANAALFIYEGEPGRFNVQAPAVSIDELINAEKATPVTVEHNENWLSYVIYTSGSTGKPKGVKVEQRGMLNHLYSRIRRFSLNTETRMAQIASHTFDISMWQMFAPLLSGGRVQIFPAATVREPHLLAGLIHSKRITHMQVVPTYLNELLLVLETSAIDLNFPQLKMVATIGEELKRSVAEKWKQRVPTAALFNTYGPTEASDTISDYEVTNLGFARIPIGRTIDNLNIYVFDKHGRLCPAAVAGEICVSGIGVGQGYIGLPEKTAAVFSTDPLDTSRRMYRTGDAGRWLNSGVLEFLGRRDSQVKLFGNRIELSEIEQVILSLSEVKQAVVMVQELAGNPVLAAYIVWNNAVVSNNELKQSLRQRLPVYMIPSQIISIDEMPLTSSGKIDRKRLTKPGAEKTNYEAPQNEKEKLLCSIWETVLSYKPAGRNDNFFEKGGHSLKATQLLLAVQKQFGCRLEIADVFAHPTVALLCNQVKIEGNYLPIPVLPEAEFYPVSPSQKRIWVLSRLNDANRAYNISGAWKLNTTIDVEKLKEAIRLTVQRHESLRTAFILQHEELRQIVAADVSIDDIFKFVNDSSEPGLLVAEVCDHEFDLSVPGLLRICLIQQSDNFLLACSLHHIIADGWSVQTMMQEIESVYNTLLASQVPQQSSLPVQYRDYAAWLDNNINQQHHSKQYWLSILEKSTALELLTDYERPSVQTFSGANIEFAITGTELAQLRRFAQQQQVSMFMLLLSAVKLLLFRHSNQQTITVGAAVAGREHPDTQELIGCFINTILLSSSIHPQSLVLQILGDVRETTLSAYGHQAYPFDQLVEESEVERDLSRNALFDVLVNYEQQSSLNFFKSSKLSDQRVYAKLDLEFDFRESDTGLSVQLIYNASLFSETTARNYTHELNTLISQLAASKGKTVKQLLECISIPDKALIEKGTGPVISYPVHAGYSNLFFKQAELHPNNIAIRDNDTSLTYAQLAAKATEVGSMLKTNDISPGTVIAVSMPRCCELAAIAIGIWNANCIYMPLDPGLPEERIGYMLEDSGARLFSIGDFEVIQKNSNETIETGTQFDGSYLLYTSGSTGRPKGVQVSADGMLNHLHSKCDDLQLNEKSIVAQTASVSFDVSIWQTFAALLAGGTVHIYSKSEVLHIKKHLHQLGEDGITVVQAVPSYLTEFISEAEKNNISNQLPSLQYLLSVGEELHGALAARWFNCFDATIVNSYGPTEAADNISMHFINSSNASKIPVGRAIANMQLYVIDSAGNLCQPGVVGEICVSGIGVAKGYIGNATEKSAEVFMQDPFDAAKWMYRTGDLGRWGVHDDMLYFCGRKDRQIKLRGQRIELAEVENVIQQCSPVKQCAVLYSNENGGSLAAYVVWRDAAAVEALESFMRRRLPAYMIPAHVVQLDKMPITASGKINRKQLPAVTNASQLVAEPGTFLERSLLQIWKKILGKENIGIHHNFFEQGGHSLKAVRLIAAVEEELGTVLKLQDVFVNPTVHTQAAFLQTEKSKATAIEKAPAAIYYPLSSAQRRMWVINQLQGGDAGYNICGGIQLEGELNVAAWETAWKQLLQRHEILRTVYVMQHGEPYQKVVDADERWNMHHIECRMNGAAVEALYRQHEATIFNLEDGPVVRASLVYCPGNKFFFLFALHHIAADEWSLDILYREMLHLYEAACNTSQHALTDLTIQYTDYAVWESNIDYAATTSHVYWLNEFSGTLPVLELPVDHARPAVKTSAGASSHIVLHGVAPKLQSLSAAANSTVFMHLVAGVNILLHRYCHQDDIITGIPVSGRNHLQLQQSAGLFLNTLPIRLALSPSHSYNDVLLQVHEKTVKAFEHKDYPFEKIVENLNLSADLSRSALFDVSIVLHEQPFANEDHTCGNVIAKPYRGNVNRSKVDLSFQFTLHGEELQLELVYNSDLFHRNRIALVLEHFRQLLNAAIATPELAISQLNYLPQYETNELLNGFQGKGILDIDGNVCKRFEVIADQRPDAGALAGTTYRQLNNQSAALAVHLIENYSIKPGDVVALKMSRSNDAIVSILAILKTGAAYLPIEKSFPQQRVNYILQDSNAKLLLTDELWNDELKNVVQHSSITNLPDTRTAESIAYIIYTSGTTGNPKGVRITDHALLNYVAGINEAYGLHDIQHLRGMLASSIAFDLGYTCLWGTLLSGGELQLAADTAYWDPRQVLEQIEKEKINFIKLTPSHFRLLLNEAMHGTKGGEQLSLIVLGGEKIVPAEMRQWLELYPNCRIANHYGPTETTIGVLTQVVSNDGDNTREMSIDAFEHSPVLGNPIGAHVVYVVDERSQLCAHGIWGELWIGGPGLSPGYINLEELTAEKFIADPFRNGHRVYRTGDKARWLQNGCIAFAGRIDEQVQLKGYRVELAEIEQALLKYDGITAAATQIHIIDGEQRLVAYAVQQNDLDEQSLANYLRELLPSYMIPWKIVQLGSLPLTANGKVNKKLLPVPDAVNTGKEKRGAANKAEATLLQAFETVFKMQDVSITAHFFEAGGDSIKAIQLSSLLYHNGWELEVKSIFQHPALDDMALQMQPLSDTQPFIHVPAADHYEVSASQRRLWFINQLENNPTVYNMVSALAIEGDFNDTAFSAAVQQLIERHEILRTVFITVDNSPRQKILSYDEHIHAYEFIDLSAKQNRNALLEEIFRVEGATPFNLSEGPLFRLKLVRMHDNLHIFILNLHHIIYDGWSKTVLEEEFMQLFDKLSGGEEFQLPQQAYQYKDYAAWQAKYFSGNIANEHRDYWLELLKGELPILQFPTDRPRPPVKTYASRKISTVLSAEVKERLHKLAGEHNTTDFTLLLSAIQILLKRYSGQDDIITGIPSAGRSRPEVSRMAGLFFNLLPVRTQFDTDETFNSIIKKLKQQTADAYHHEDYPFDYLIEQLRVRRDLSRSALFDVLVVSQDFGKPPVSVKKENSYYVREMETGFSGNKFDLTFYFRREERGLSMTIGYNATIFNASRIEKLSVHFTNLLEALLFNPDTNIVSHSYLTKEEVVASTHGFNNTIRPYSDGKLLHQLFEEATERNPSAEALRQNGSSLSYAELNSTANIIARKLQSKGVASGDNVGILTGRNFSMIQGMFGILKAGAAYVPIDPAYPADRQRYIITNSHIHFILTDDVAIAAKAIAGLDDIAIIDLKDESDNNYDDRNLFLDKQTTDLAYTIYTSGSSGRPKGVMIEHHSAVNLVEWVNKEYNIGSNDRMLFITSMCFDLSVYDIFGILAAGGCIVIATLADVQDLSSVKKLLLEERISFWDTVPTTLNYLVTELAHSKEPFVQHDLRVAFLSGDWIPVSLPTLAKKFFPNVNVISLGGATEGTVWSNYFPVGEVDPKWMSIPYGKPITNNFFYILDEGLNPVPQGVAGELFIGGVGVSRGYINDPVKTAAAFMPDPFCKALGGRMYRTGDLGRMLPDGNMEFLGRKDFQVKIRGFRVELGEIEQVLTRFPGIQTVLVTASEDNSGIKFLVAYYLGDDHFTSGALTAFLSRQLPDYMIPAFFIKMDSFPLNTNGKIDRKALPQPLAQDMETGERLPPRTPTEQAVAGIWSNVLKKDLFGVQDNFFMLGGHSLSASQVVARIREELGVPLKLPSIFINPTVEGLANEIDALKWIRTEPVAPVIQKNKIII
jgi:tyrocidine synthetase III